MRYFVAAAAALCVATSAGAYTVSGTLSQPGDEVVGTPWLSSGNYVMRWEFDRPLADTEWGAPEEFQLSYTIAWQAEWISEERWRVSARSSWMKNRVRSVGVP